MLHRPVYLVALAIALIGGHASHACSVFPIATAAQLVADSDTIYRVRAQGYVFALPPARGYTAPIRFAVLETVKGEPVAEVALEGSLAGEGDYNDRPVPYNFVRNAGRGGSCFADRYGLGREFLLIMKRGRTHWSPLAPTNEQVRGPSDPWLQWIKDEVARRHAP